jgi:hypothetical protein
MVIIGRWINVRANYCKRVTYDACERAYKHASHYVHAR